MMGKIITTFEYPPIPDRRWDWSAIRDGYEPGDLIGEGETEAAAIFDLLTKEEEAADTKPAAPPAPKKPQGYALLYVDADASGQGGRTIKVPM
jgi:hypothetical protein